MKRGRGRGRLGCPRPAVSRQQGYTLIEVLFALGVAAVLSGIAAGAVMHGIGRARGLAAARSLASRMTLARMQAAAWGTSVALRFEETAAGLGFSVYRDGNRNGVRTAEIESGVDLEIEPPALLAERFPGVRIGLAPGAPIADPVHIGNTTILSFSPRGTATSGTIYIAGPDGSQWAVRVLGATGRTRVLRHDAERDEWTIAY